MSVMPKLNWSWVVNFFEESLPLKTQILAEVENSSRGVREKDGSLRNAVGEFFKQISLCLKEGGFEGFNLERIKSCSSLPEQSDLSKRFHCIVGVYRKVMCLDESTFQEKKTIDFFKNQIESQIKAALKFLENSRHRRDLDNSESIYGYTQQQRSNIWLAFQMLWDLQRGLKEDELKTFGFVNEFFIKIKNIKKDLIRNFLKNQDNVLAVAEKDSRILLCIPEKMISGQEFKEKLRSKNIDIPDKVLPQNEEGVDVFLASEVLNKLLDEQVDIESVNKIHEELVIQRIKAFKELLSNDSYVQLIKRKFPDMPDFKGDEGSDVSSAQHSGKRLRIIVKIKTGREGCCLSALLSEKDSKFMQEVVDIICEVVGKPGVDLQFLREKKLSEDYEKFLKGSRKDLSGLENLKCLLANPKFVAGIAKINPQISDYVKKC